MEEQQHITTVLGPIDADLWLFTAKQSAEALEGLPAAEQTPAVKKALRCEKLLLEVFGTHMTAQGAGSPQNDTPAEKLPFPLQLSAEILEQIFKLTNTAALATFALVSRQWAEVALHLLWGHPHFSLPLQSSVEKLFKFYASADSNNAARVRRLTVSYGAALVPSQLTGLALTNSRLTHAMLRKLPRSLPALASVELVSTCIPGNMLAELARSCPMLTELDMHAVEGVQPQDLHDFCQLAGGRLTRLNISGPGRVIELAVSNQKFMSIVDGFEACTALRTLALPGVRVAAHHLKRLLAVLPGCLEAIDVSNTSINLQCIETLVHRCNGLTAVILTHCTEIKDDSIKLLAAECGDLTAIAIGHTETSDAGIRALAQSCGANLRRISVNGCTHVSDLGLGVLGVLCPNISLLDVSKCPRINVSGVLGFLKSATDAAARKGNKILPLRHLNLSVCSPTILSTDMLNIVHMCPNLRTFLIPTTRSQKARAELGKRGVKDPEATYRAFFPSVWIRPCHLMKVGGGIGLSAGETAPLF
ncbi:hypothetical protein HDU87_006031 [Geranomyces variabilis]|uniref:F-box domain-containing protein n=1 Tax=Geranomyces variabilis TaxID=109894 RepID=A0AAD5TQA8_9FUNG|nr:hypothetical protein HDU87_006031 [Geranomyces variabilis]